MGPCKDLPCLCSLIQSCRDKGALDEDEARRLFQQLVVAMDYCHQMGVVNRQGWSSFLCLVSQVSCLQWSKITELEGLTSVSAECCKHCSSMLTVLGNARKTLWNRLVLARTHRCMLDDKCIFLKSWWGLSSILQGPIVHKFGWQSSLHCRDIKLENTLLDGSKRLVKITDFGYAKSNIDSMPISNVGTPNYAGKSSSLACFTEFAMLGYSHPWVSLKPGLLDSLFYALNLLFAINIFADTDCCAEKVQHLQAK